MYLAPEGSTAWEAWEAWEGRAQKDLPARSSVYLRGVRATECFINAHRAARAAGEGGRGRLHAGNWSTTDLNPSRAIW